MCLEGSPNTCRASAQRSGSTRSSLSADLVDGVANRSVTCSRNGRRVAARRSSHPLRWSHVHEWPRPACWIEESSRRGLWSHRCGWDELATSYDGLDGTCGELEVGQDWTRRWSAIWRYAGHEVVCAVHDLGSTPAAGCGCVVITV